MRIFLSYPSEARQSAELIAYSLRSSGHWVFLDKDTLPAGHSYDNRIKAEIERSDIFVFLVTPMSFEAGRYTLTELEFARAAFGNSSGRVLPVMIEPTAIADISPFLKSVTILKPVGNIPAEVAAAVQHLRSPERRYSMTVKGGLVALVAALLCAPPLWWELISWAGLRTAYYYLAPGLPIVVTLWYLERNKFPYVLLPVATVAFAVLVGDPIMKSYAVVTGDLVTSAEELMPFDFDFDADADEKERKSRQTAVVDTVKETGQVINLAAKWALLGVLGAIAVLAGSAAAAPETQGIRRWVLSIAFLSAGMSAAALLMWGLFKEPGLFGGMIVESFTPLFFFPISGALLGYWIGSGQETSAR